MNEYVGAIHIHSVYSDGTGKIEDIARDAYESGLDFIMMTDHNTLKPKEDGYEKWISNVMVIIGYEVNDIFNKNHYLVFGMEEVIGTYQVLENGELGCKLPAKEYVKLIKEKGGIGFIAHPDEQRLITAGHVAYPWTQWDTDDFTGIEIWNHMSEWIEGMNEQNKLDRFLHPLKSIISPPQKTLARWDIIAQKRKVSAIGSVDAHAFKQNLLGFFEVEIFSYKVLFKSIRTHVLVDEEIESINNFEDAKNKILNAVRLGRSFTANSYHGDAKGFRFYAEQDGVTCIMGDDIKIKPGKNIVMRVLVPKPCTIKLIRSGKKISEVNGMNMLLDVKETGVYRVECWIGDRGWIFSNHIRVLN